MQLCGAPTHHPTSVLIIPGTCGGGPQGWLGRVGRSVGLSVYLAAAWGWATGALLVYVAGDDDNFLPAACTLFN